MKHIKHINEGFNIDDYYVNLTKDEYEKVAWDTYDNKESFDSKEVDFLKKNTVICHWENESGSTTEEFDDSYKVRIKQKREMRRLKRMGENIYITKLKDSYYVVNFNSNINELYKCDQFEGLVRLLKDKMVIK